MIADSYIVPECTIGPGSFGGLMALYESNFIKLNMLVGEVGGGGEQRLSTTPDDCDLYLSVESRTRYTHILRMTYFFDDEVGGAIADPDLVIRVYLDARMAEVAGWARHHRHAMLHGLARRFGHELNRRWSHNMMFSKWLDFLLQARHSFSDARSLRPDAATRAIEIA